MLFFRLNYLSVELNGFELLLYLRLLIDYGVLLLDDLIIISHILLIINPNCQFSIRLHKRLLLMLLLEHFQILQCFFDLVFKLICRISKIMNDHIQITFGAIDHNLLLVSLCLIKVTCKFFQFIFLLQRIELNRATNTYPCFCFLVDLLINELRIVIEFLQRTCFIF